VDYRGQSFAAQAVPYSARWAIWCHGGRACTWRTLALLTESGPPWVLDGQGFAASTIDTTVRTL
jgi:hypothetical protein